METLKISDITKGECMNCGNKMGHTKMYSFVEGMGDGILEYNCHYICCRCRNMFKKLKALDEQIASLEKKKLDEEFALFSRKLNN